MRDAWSHRGRWGDGDTEPRCKHQAHHTSLPTPGADDSIGPRDPPQFLTKYFLTFPCYYRMQGSKVWHIKLATSGLCILILVHWEPVLWPWSGHFTSRSLILFFFKKFIYLFIFRAVLGSLQNWEELERPPPSPRPHIRVASSLTNTPYLRGAFVTTDIPKLAASLSSELWKQEKDQWVATCSRGGRDQRAEHRGFLWQ